MAKGPPRKQALRSGPERDRMVEANLGLARKAARHYAVGDEQLYDEYFSVACDGLTRAADLWNASFEDTFSTYAYLACVRSIIRCRQLERRRRETSPVVDEDIPEPEPDAGVSVETGEALRLAITSLPKRLRFVLCLRFGIGGIGTHKLAEVAARLKCTRERVRQLEEKAIEALRAALPLDHPDLFRRGSTL